MHFRSVQANAVPERPAYSERTSIKLKAESNVTGYKICYKRKVQGAMRTFSLACAAQISPHQEAAPSTQSSITVEGRWRRGQYNYFR